MALHLKNPSQFPPGGFDFQQTEGISYYFAPEGGLRQTATRVLDFRKANKLPRATFEECALDIEAYVISRLGGASSPYVEDTDVIPAQATAKRGGGGGCCGAKLT